MGAFGTSAQQSAIQGRVAGQRQRMFAPVGMLTGQAMAPMGGQAMSARGGMAQAPPSTATAGSGGEQAPLQTTLFHMLRSGKGKGGEVTGPEHQGAERRSIPYDVNNPPSALPSGRAIQT